MDQEFSLHLFWIGEHRPIWLESSLSLWKSRYPKIFKYWTDVDLLEHPNWNYHISENWPKAMQVDVLRVLAVQEYGGWYVDADTTPKITNFPSSNKIVLVREDGKKFWNGCFHAPKSHKFLKIWLEEILLSINEMSPDERDVASISGPLAMSRAIYLYASQFGISACKNEFLIAPWGFVTHNNRSPFFSMLNRGFGRRSILQHFGEASWLVTDQKKTKLISDITYYFRRTKYSTFFDSLRQVIRNSNKLPNSFLHILLLRNLDNRILDTTPNWAAHEMKIQTRDELISAYRNLTIGIIECYESQLCQNLVFAGWVERRPGKWVRPRVTDFGVKLN